MFLQYDDVGSGCESVLRSRLSYLNGGSCDRLSTETRKGTSSFHSFQRWDYVDFEKIEFLRGEGMRFETGECLRSIA